MTAALVRGFGKPRLNAVLAACTVAALLALIWMFKHAEAVDAQRHFGYTQSLLGLREAETLIDGEVLALRLELTLNYDELAVQLRRAANVSASLNDVPQFLPSAARMGLAGTADELSRAVASKAEQVDAFRRKHAVLKNSLAYFPVAAEAALGGNGRDREGKLNAAVADYVRHLLVFSRTGAHDRLAKAADARQDVERLRASATTGEPVSTLMRHGRLIERYIPEVDELVRGILDHRSAAKATEMEQKYADVYAREVRAAERYRRVLYAITSALTAYLAYVMVHLIRARGSLTAAHNELSERYAAQLVAEKQLRLHATAFRSAHDGITLTDAAGNILDVNPAFSRITGYSAEEAIGHNPRLLKSGRHDGAFYAAMWASIERTGSWRGEVWNRNKAGEIYPELLSISAVRDAEGAITNYVAVFADISKIKEQETRLSHLAYFDALTELPNRVLLADRISQAIQQTMRGGAIMALCYLDLDGFKAVNDGWGHDAGDQLLVEMANRLRQGVRGGDTVARLGGDEFVVLLLGLENVQECVATVERLLATVAKPLQLRAATVSLSASIGVTVYPQEATDADSLLRQADQAMYRAKQAGKNNFEMFDAAQDRDARNRHDRIARIKDALSAHELVLFYQPKVDMRKGTVTGAEALIRWNHPERGILAPGEFLPWVEDHELIVEIGEWVLETALAQLDRWADEGVTLNVSVNIAGRHLQHPRFVARLEELLRGHPRVAGQLELEVLETTALEDVEKISSVIQACKTLGVRFALDDFGTGYSSLTYLKRLPAHTIKVDQSFVREMLTDTDNLVIVQGVLGLARAFQRNVIAEGVETADHGRLLLQLECDQAQGYGIARPMPCDRFVPWMREWQADPAWMPYRTMRWRASDYPMLVAEVEHRCWIAALLGAAREGQPLAGEYTSDEASCRFGAWYLAHGRSAYGHLPEYAAAAAPHRELHAIADRFGSLWREGATDRALGLIPELVQARDSVLDAMRALQLAVGVKR